MRLLTKEQQESYQNAKFVIFVKKSLKKKKKKMKDKKYRIVRDHCPYIGKYRGAVHIICNLKQSVPKRNPKVFHNGSNYDYHFIIKELVEEF